ncbi:general stress protein [Paenibacillus swuensis]|uniref:General stress protein n=2 Tax=Paenibacillus swuensis TaxID=1178515 RepID=A0A172TFT2_9BACL|nr:general stress protein [Paenibacillus swuensis]
MAKTKVLTEVLNQQVANWSVLYMKLHNYHWYVKGPQFFTLHVKFEELYNEASLHIDELAERLLTLGGQPIATMKGCLELSSIKEAQGDEKAENMVASLVKDFETVVQESKDGQAIAQEQGDEVTADMLLAIYSGVEKHNWMLSSFLGK